MAPEGLSCCAVYWATGKLQPETPIQLSAGEKGSFRHFGRAGDAKFLGRRRRKETPDRKPAILISSCISVLGILLRAEQGVISCIKGRYGKGGLSLLVGGIQTLAKYVSEGGK